MLLNLAELPAGWRLVHLGQNSFGEWSVELTHPMKPDGHPQGWYCACVHKLRDLAEAWRRAISLTQRPEYRHLEPGVWHINPLVSPRPARSRSRVIPLADNELL